MSAIAGGPRLTEDERRAAFAAPPPKVPRHVIVLVLLACCMLGFGGVVADHFFGGPAGKATKTTIPPGGTNPPPLVSGGNTPSFLPASVGALMEWQSDSGAAPAFALLGRDGRTVSLRSLRGKVVVLSFFDSRCDDICPVVEAELSDAWHQLQAAGDAGRVDLVAVNTDPLATAASDGAPAEGRAVAAMGRHFLYLTGSLHELNSVWVAYSVSVDVQQASGVVSHNDAMYFVAPSGHLAAHVTPFANQVGEHQFTLPASTVARFASGIADEVRGLLGAGGHS